MNTFREVGQEIQSSGFLIPNINGFPFYGNNRERLLDDEEEFKNFRPFVEDCLKKGNYEKIANKCSYFSRLFKAIKCAHIIKTIKKTINYCRFYYYYEIMRLWDYLQPKGPILVWFKKMRKEAQYLKKKHVDIYNQRVVNFTTNKWFLYFFNENKEDIHIDNQFYLNLAQSELSKQNLAKFESYLFFENFIEHATFVVSHFQKSCSAIVYFRNITFNEDHHLCRWFIYSMMQFMYDSAHNPFPDKGKYVVKPWFGTPSDLLAAVSQNRILHYVVFYLPTEHINLAEFYKWAENDITQKAKKVKQEKVKQEKVKREKVRLATNDQKEDQKLELRPAAYPILKGKLFNMFVAQKKEFDKSRFILPLRRVSKYKKDYATGIVTFPPESAEDIAINENTFINLLYCQLCLNDIIDYNKFERPKTIIDILNFILSSDKRYRVLVIEKRQ